MSRPPFEMDGPYRPRRVRRIVLRWLVLAMFGALLAIKFGGAPWL
ncbi:MULTISPECIES: hypothetical protein [Delftia]|nr:MULTISPECIES: hypothetical protein [Delftia]EPD44768.1 hypothetical protein HMPREF9701_00356 [Delftia acidovorans CCUG 274B]